LDVPADTPLESDVENLSSMTLRDLRDIDETGWCRATERLTREAQRPRPNFSGSGPPGRTD